MAHPCRAIAFLVFAAVTAHANVTISWNTRAHPSPPPPAASRAVVAAVNGTRVLLRLPDGSTRTYTASPEQARLLRSLVGTRIRYRVK